jgi:hypothetical protein
LQRGAKRRREEGGVRREELRGAHPRLRRGPGYAGLRCRSGPGCAVAAPHPSYPLRGKARSRRQACRGEAHALAGLLSAVIGRDLPVIAVIANEPSVDNLRDRFFRDAAFSHRFEYYDPEAGVSPGWRGLLSAS